MKLNKQTNKKDLNSKTDSKEKKIQLTNSETYLMIQCAAVITHCLSTKTPPHQWPTLPACGWVKRIETCQGNSPSYDRLPPTIRSVNGISLLYRLIPHAAFDVKQIKLEKIYEHSWNHKDKIRTYNSMISLLNITDRQQ